MTCRLTDRRRNRIIPTICLEDAAVIAGICLQYDDAEFRACIRRVQAMLESGKVIDTGDYMLAAVQS